MRVVTAGPYPKYGQGYSQSPFDKRLCAKKYICNDLLQKQKMALMLSNSQHGRHGCGTYVPHPCLPCWELLSMECVCVSVLIAPCLANFIMATNYS